MTLSEILGRGVSMEWYEGVALVRAVVTRLTERSGDSVVLPELRQIEIADGGDVRVTGGARTSEPVRRLGQLLQATLGHTEVPVQLRLAIVQATAPTPAFASIHDFDEALAYFERPGRETMLKDLYGRAAAAAPPQNAISAPTLDAVAPLPSPDPANTAKPRARARLQPRRALLVGAGAAIVVLIGAMATVYARRGPGSVGRSDVSAIARQASDAIAAATLAGLSAVTQRTGLGRLSAANGLTAEAPDVPHPPALRIPSGKRSARKHRLDSPSTSSIVVFDLDTLHPDVELVAYASEPSAPPDMTGAEELEPGIDPVFSPGSAGVSPPVAVRPQLPRELPPNVKPEQLCRVELMVTEAGTVESVKLLGTPRSVHDSMLLSAAKAWQFHPALKDGRPVKYRKTVWLAAQ